MRHDEHVPRFIDLNADLGESTERWTSGEDVELLAVVTSANVCTGAYAGDDELISATCAAAAERGVTVGAQVGYPDREGFGRKPMDVDPSVLTAEIAQQIGVSQVHVSRILRACLAKLGDHLEEAGAEGTLPGS